MVPVGAACVSDLLFVIEYLSTLESQVALPWYIVGMIYCRGYFRKIRPRGQLEILNTTVNRQDGIYGGTFVSWTCSSSLCGHGEPLLELICSEPAD